jgi:hypothetical protein
LLHAFVVPSLAKAIRYHELSNFTSLKNNVSSRMLSNASVRKSKHGTQLVVTFECNNEARTGIVANDHISIVKLISRGEFSWIERLLRSLTVYTERQVSPKGSKFLNRLGGTFAPVGGCGLKQSVTCFKGSGHADSVPQPTIQPFPVFEMFVLNSTVSVELNVAVRFFVLNAAQFELTPVSCVPHNDQHPNV